MQRSKADARTKRRGLLLILAGICYGLVGLRGVQLLVEVAVYNLAPTRGHDSVRTNIALDLLGAASVLLGIVCIFVGLRMLRTGGRQKDGGSERESHDVSDCRRTPGFRRQDFADPMERSRRGRRSPGVGGRI